MSRKPNFLINEKSPYLQEHAFNPVEWRPWGDEALKKAKNDGKPIFLSIGYSTCHWCHQLARESFEDETIAAMINKNFIPIKVDREERPELDAYYLKAVQAMTGGGGWPLSVFLTPDLKPFYGGTYFPPEARYNMPSFRQVLEFVAKAWKDKKSDMVENVEQSRRQSPTTFLARGGQSCPPGCSTTGTRRSSLHSTRSTGASEARQNSLCRPPPPTACDTTAGQGGNWR